MGDLDTLVVAEEVGDVLADDIATAHRGDPDLAARARTDVTVAGVALDRIVVDTVPRGDRARDRERGTGRRVALGLVVGLDALGVQRGTERARGLADEAEHEVHAEREVRGDDDRGDLRELREQW